MNIEHYESYLFSHKDSMSKAQFFMRNAQAHVLMRKNQNFSRLGLANLFVAVHVLVIFLIVARGYIVHPFLVVEIPFHGFLDALFEL